MLSNPRIGFIGGGNMAEAIIKGLLSGGVSPNQIKVSEPLPQRREHLGNSYSVAIFDDNATVAGHSDILILAIKPQMAASVLTALEPLINETNLVISIMAGITTNFIEEALQPGVRVIRAMPNTPALIQAGATAICHGRKASPTDMDKAGEIFLLCGTVVPLPSEKLMDAVTALSGSGPAYVFAFVEALSDAGVKNGLPRDVASTLAVQTVLGSIRMIAETGEHPAILKEKVTSPGGTTIAGLHTLERGGFHGLVMDAVDSAAKRSQELSGK